MWQWLMDRLPDVPFANGAWNALMSALPDIAVGTFELRDWLNIVIAIIGIRLAILAHRIAKRQQDIQDVEIARETKLSPWAFYDSVPMGWFGLTVWSWSAAPVEILRWKLIIRVDSIIDIEVTEVASRRSLTKARYVGPFMPTPPAYVNWQVEGTAPITIPAGDNNFIQFAICRVTRPASLAGTELQIGWEMTTKHRKYIGVGKDAIKVKPPGEAPVDNSDADG